MVLLLEKYIFDVQWTDKNSESVWKYQLLYYPETNKIEMHDIKNRRLFLKKSTCEHLILEMMYPGNRISVLARQLKILDYEDKATKDALKNLHERSCLIAARTSLQHVGKILHEIAVHGLFLSELKIRRCSSADILPAFSPVVSSRENGLLVFEVIGTNAVPLCGKIANQLDSSTKLYAPEDPDEVEDVLTTVRQQEKFNGEWTEGCSVAIIKPHAFRDGTAASILGILADEFLLRSACTAILDLEEANRFCDVYKDVLNTSEFSEMVTEFSSGLILVLNVLSKDPGVLGSVENLREICGPMDPELARLVKPQSLRGQFGLNKAQNAVHCTDLQEDTQGEFKFFFNQQ